MTIRLASLDMAGTTIDEANIVYDVLRETVEAATGATIEDALLAKWTGTSKYEAIVGLLRALRSEADAHVVFAQFSASLDDAYEEDPPILLPGIDGAVRRMREAGIKVALQTGYTRTVAETMLDAVGWRVGDDIDALVTSDEVTVSRPAPFLIFRSMEATDVRSVHEVLVAGDTPNDLKAGTAAGVAMVVGVLTGANTAEELGIEQHTHLLSSLADLDELLPIADISELLPL